MQIVQFNANSHISEQAPQPPTPTILFPGGISIIVNSKIKPCPLPFYWYLCSYFNMLTKVDKKAICCDGKHLHLKKHC